MILKDPVGGAKKQATLLKTGDDIRSGNRWVRYVFEHLCGKNYVKLFRLLRNTAVGIDHIVQACEIRKIGPSIICVWK